VLVTKGRLQTGAGKPALTIRARQFIDAIRAQYSGVPLVPPAGPRQATGSKSL
jgi:hypothetical protein